MKRIPRGVLGQPSPRARQRPAGLRFRRFLARVDGFVAGIMSPDCTPCVLHAVDKVVAAVFALSETARLKVRTLDCEFRWRFEEQRACVATQRRGVVSASVEMAQSSKIRRLP